MSALLGIRRYGIEALRELMASWGEKGFRATQLLRWLYARQATSYQEMTTLPTVLREKLERLEPLALPQLLERRVSLDGTRKFLLRLADGATVETVGIPRSDKRLTVCFSTQVGCAMGCAFCTTGTHGLTRSLVPGEMVDQLTVVSQDFGTRITNAVAMGEGEPFANYAATLDALRIMNSPSGLGIGARHLTVSSCGLLGPLRRFAQEPEQFTLAISLHSAIQKTRNALMPALVNQPLDALRLALLSYGEKTGRRPSLEFALIDNVNDTSREITALIDFAHGMLCHVNLIPFNVLNGLHDADTLSGAHNYGQTRRHDQVFAPSPAERVAAIATRLQKVGIKCSVRRSRGADIGGACGQLKGYCSDSEKGMS
ncbi:MAG: 23S rRNA (adenine(2503)-C(2))-methyltransferase RlmN [Coriobacteriales bacterium]|jgi:23S rRNA (adenine2503-C2)-methyltransferase|nr:23S rRNA (adenine(2503)-C(2))-methyltransferase RlmN [Coriobacteriales bacterium]